MSGINWLHLSDWHQLGKDFNRDVVREKLLKDIEDRTNIDAALGKIDFIVFSGDVAQNGKKEEYEAVKEQLFDPILERTGLTPDKLFIVPGNHDIDRDTFDVLPSALEKPFEKEDEVIKWLDAGKRKKILEPFTAFTSFVTDYTKQKQPDYADCFILPIDNVTVALAGLNSALMCGRKKDLKGETIDKNYLVLGEPQVKDALSQIAGADIRIVVLHHNFDWLTGFDRDLVEAQMRKQSHFILHGHTHRPTVERSTGSMGDCVIISAGACFGKRNADDQRYVNGFNFTHLDLESWKGEVFLRRWSENQTAWIADTDTCKDGRYQIVIPKRNAVDISFNPRIYLSKVLIDCKDIDIRGIQGAGTLASRLDIEKIYTTLHMIGGMDQEEMDRDLIKQERQLVREKVCLDEVLKNRASIIIGDPGSGKSTFLKRITTVICRTLLNEEPDGCSKKLGLEFPPIPVFIRLFDLAAYINSCREKKEPDCPVTDDSPAWIFHYLGKVINERCWGLSRKWFEEQCEKKNGAILLLDGLDEAPDTSSRNTIIQLINNAIIAYPECKIVITSRRVAYEAGAALRGVTRCDIAPLDDEGISIFIKQWCDVLYHDMPDNAQKHFENLERDIFARSTIRQMAASPIMLTALSVLHWNNRRLPDQRAELYESVIGWLLDSRDMKRPGRIKRDECRELLQMIALAMQECKDGRQQSIERGELITLLSPYMKGEQERKPRKSAEQFIENEEADSGIIRACGNLAEFWHLTFLEYLAARELAGMTDDELQTRLLKLEIFNDPNWRDTLLLLIGILWGHGRKRVEGFFNAMLGVIDKICMEHSEENNELECQARCFGLMGAMQRELQTYKFSIKDSRFDKLQKRVEGIFDPDRAKNIAITVRVAAADALGQAGDHRIIEDLRTEPARKKMFIEIPAGEFLMGAQKKNKTCDNFDEEANDDEAPVHKVHLSAFAICRYPVTVSQYEVFVNEDGYKRAEFWSAGKEEKQEKPYEWEQQLVFPNSPVVDVSWYEARAFCSWAGLQLPTEAQWERAARGPGGLFRKYPWGNEKIDIQRANYGVTEIYRSSPVGCFPLGNVLWDTEKGLWLADMAGNVWEWCSDWYGNYSSGSKRDPIGPGNGTCRVLRGGSWGYGSEYCRCANRIYNIPCDRGNGAGFRVVFVP